jgi:hypothetical protein
VAGQLAEGLVAVHACGLLHRDVKPANVVIGDNGCPRLVDFGLASPVGSDALRGISGTVAYMAPEQARGLSERIDQRTDVFGVGATLYELLTGRPPHRGTTNSEIWAAARTGDIVAPKELTPGLPETVDRLCMRCLAKDPADRFGSATELREAIRACQRRAPGLGSGKKLRWVGAVGLAAALLAGLMLWPLLAPKGPPATGSRPELAGDVDVLIWSRGQEAKRWGKVADAAVPVRNGALVRLEVRLSQPAYLYLLWVESGGTVKPLYPWDPAGGFAGGMPAQTARVELHSPTELDRGWEVQIPTGQETALLLARRSPLPADVDLPALIGTLGPTRLGKPQEVAMLEPKTKPGSTPPKVVPRKLVTDEAKPIDEPALVLQERLKPHFELMKAVRFVPVGD